MVRVAQNNSLRILDASLPYKILRAIFHVQDNFSLVKAAEVIHRNVYIFSEDVSKLVRAETAACKNGCEVKPANQRRHFGLMISQEMARIIREMDL